MNSKIFLVILFILLNVLTFVYAQNNQNNAGDNTNNNGDDTDNKNPGGDTDNKNPGGDAANNQSSTTSSSSTVPTPVTTPSSKETQPSNNNNNNNNNSNNKQVQPINTSTTVPNQAKQISTPGNSPKNVQPVKTSSITVTVNLSTPAIQPLSTKVIQQQVTKAVTQQQEKKTTIVRKYPQTAFVDYEQNKEDMNAKYLSSLYIISVVMCTALVGFATLTLYKKGLGDETSNASKTWESSFDDDGYRNKSTISRNTLTPSIRNTTLGSPSSNPTTNSRY
ncbi:hypothetical protein PIROE2DRAFT_68694 [Piromyces sp. E2]|nr:hypothetical protein PIROE2DRAFT_68694 [Piromyces sp. E2]|eukprot:OUM68415.1 hypothetical protein PIROE2DRAFT_68694 [Piromyces sp. E2]